jgi:hypothetical protein
MMMRRTRKRRLTNSTLMMMIINLNIMKMVMPRINRIIIMRIKMTMIIGRITIV